MRFVLSAGRHLLLAACCLVAAGLEAPAATFRVATYNLEGYFESPVPGRLAKTEAGKAKIRESIQSANPDVLALQELGSPGALRELKEGLKQNGLDLPYSEFVSGHDTNAHLGVLSRFPFALRRFYTNESFLLSGRRFHVSRGFGEVKVQVSDRYSFTLLTAHLKSRRASAMADEAELRLAEAKLLREKVDGILKADPRANLVVLGDFNDTQDTPAIRTLIGRGRTRLTDTRPVERNGDERQPAESRQRSRAIAWTHFFAKEDTYSRIDYILLSPGMAREWVPDETFIVTVPGWGIGSDHRPLVATFEAGDN